MKNKNCRPIVNFESFIKLCHLVVKYSLLLGMKNVGFKKRKNKNIFKEIMMFTGKKIKKHTL